jgi:hypothetical protein
MALRGNIRSLDSTLQQHADGHLCDGLHSSLLVSLDFIDADIVLTVAG